MATITFEGIEFGSLASLCKYKGVNYNTVMCRLNKNIPLHDALQSGTFKRKDVEQFCYLGKVYDSKSACCISHGLDYPLVNYYSRQLNLSIQDTLTLLLNYFSGFKNTNKPSVITSIPAVIYKGVWYYKLEDFCEDCGITMLFFKNYKYRYKIKDNIDVMRKIKNHKKDFYLYKGEYCTYTYLTALVRSKKLSYLELKKLPKTTVNCYSECTFIDSGLCIDTVRDFKTYLNTYIKKDTDYKE